jgi:hypothetical protein
MRHPQPLFHLFCTAVLLVAGCGIPGGGWLHPAGHHGTELLLPNPLLVPPNEQEFLWNQVVETVDNYFRIQREERIRTIGDVITEGRIDTFPTDGSTLLEPWRKDSTHGFEKWHATLQTVRRHAVVRVSPTGGGYLIDVTVFKELEDVYQPEQAAAGGTIRYEAFESSDTRNANGGALSLGWIPLGRDVSLEQRMLAEIQHRLSR